MSIDPAKTNIFHITDISNLSAIFSAGHLHSDAMMQASENAPTEIGYSNIKIRRLTEYRVPCCGGRYVGEFVPFYFCPRSPMLYTINRGNTGRAPGCQKDIVHLVSLVQRGFSLGRQWAISDGNAGANYTMFSNAPNSLDEVPWDIVNSDSWGGDRMNKKATEFLVADSFPVTEIVEIGCFNDQAALTTKAALAANGLQIPVNVRRYWYY